LISHDIAIENVLIRCEALQANAASRIQVCKLRDFDLVQQQGQIKVLRNPPADNTLADVSVASIAILWKLAGMGSHYYGQPINHLLQKLKPQCIIGGTAWSIRSGFGKGKEPYQFDLLIVDEVLSLFLSQV
jgi:hypothetical protein